MLKWHASRRRLFYADALLCCFAMILMLSSRALDFSLRRDLLLIC